MLLKSEDFPVAAAGSHVVSRNGRILLQTHGSDYAQEIALRLNRDDQVYPSEDPPR